ncbi:MAG: hypothetical protein NVSMB31_08920 [Vulcanimicrobiaceae bacterium]
MISARRSVLAAMLALLVLATSSAARVRAADQRDFWVYNKGDEPIHYLYVSHISEDKWGDDVLGEDVLMPGERVKVKFSDDSDVCHYDVRVEYKDKHSDEDRDVDLCDTASISFDH